MDAPKPGSWIKKPTFFEQKAEVDAVLKEANKQEAPRTKKPFVVQPHLTQKPLKNNPELAKLKNSLEKE